MYKVSHFFQCHTIESVRGLSSPLQSRHTRVMIYMYNTVITSAKEVMYSPSSIPLQTYVCFLFVSNAKSFQAICRSPGAIMEYGCGKKSSNFGVDPA